MSSVDAFALLDRRAELYKDIVLGEEFELKRQLMVSVNDPEKKTMLALYPDDFTLCHLGSYDRDTGIIHMPEEYNGRPRRICVLSEMVVKPKGVDKCQETE